ncbi:MAG: hypothetical protein ACRBBW_02830 [Cellvibrionaceae bacterium]
MKLSYDTSSLAADSAANVLILENPLRWRIEMHLRRNEDQSYTLVAMSGIHDQPAQLSKLQGPYENRQQACAARRAIAIALIAKDFNPKDAEHSIWTLQAQKAIQNLRQQRTLNRGNYDFHPDDVL